MAQKVVFNDGSIKVRPYVSTEQIKEIAMKYFGLKIHPDSVRKEFNSYDDRNFFIEGELLETTSRPIEQYKSFDKFVLKIFNTCFTYRHQWYENLNRMSVDCYNKCSPHFKLVLPVHGVDNSSMGMLHDLPLTKDVEVIGCSLEELPAKTDMITFKHGVYYARHMVRLSVFIPGKVVDIKTISDQLAFSYGKSAAVLDLALKDQPAPEYDAQKTLPWNLIYVMENVYDPYVTSMIDTQRKQIVENVLHEFSNVVLPKLQQLQKQWIHGDLNDQNVIQDESGVSNKILGIIDSDDMVYSYRVVELAIVLMYLTATSTRERSMDLAKHAFHGYCTLMKLSDIELDILYNLMLIRYVQSSCISEYQYRYHDPGNEYLLITAKTGWDNFVYMISLGKEKFLSKLQEQL